LIFENTLNKLSYKVVDNGFSERAVNGDRIRAWAMDFNDPNSPSKINLYKLHGSLDWEYKSDTEEISIKKDLSDGHEPLIIFGSHTKMLSFDPFLYILSKFRETLEKSTLFIIIGYSFHDKYINNLIIQQLSQNTSFGIAKKMLIVNPCYKDKTAKQVAEELQEIQTSKSINDIINFRHISPDRIEIIGINTGEFYTKYLCNNAELLQKELEQTESSYKVF
jgi:hypothetical protein